MDATEGLKKVVADRKASLVNSKKVLDAAVKESQESRHKRMEEQRRQE